MQILQQLNMGKVRYQYFDFHSECKHMRWDRISILLDQMKDDLVRQGYAIYLVPVCWIKLTSRPIGTST